MLTLIWFVFAVTLLVAAGISIHVRRKGAVASETPVVDDHVIEQILETGVVFIEEDEPLDLDDVDDEEERFWSESWDEPTGEW